VCVHILCAQTDSLYVQAVRRADFAEMELAELKPTLRRLSVGGHDMGDAGNLYVSCITRWRALSLREREREEHNMGGSGILYVCVSFFPV
jgi:hypothetical protein